MHVLDSNVATFRSPMYISQPESSAWISRSHAACGFGVLFVCVRLEQRLGRLFLGSPAMPLAATGGDTEWGPHGRPCPSPAGAASARLEPALVRASGPGALNALRRGPRPRVPSGRGLRSPRFIHGALFRGTRRLEMNIGGVVSSGCAPSLRPCILC